MSRTGDAALTMAVVWATMTGVPGWMKSVSTLCAALAVPEAMGTGKAPRLAVV